MFLSKIWGPQRRSLTQTLAAVVMAMVLVGVSGQSAHAETATKFMQRVARDLMAAAKQHRVTPLVRVIHKYADVRGIGRSALGRHVKYLRPGQRRRYQNGMVRFMARYAVTQIPKYPVRTAKIVGRGFPYRGQTGVDSRVTLANGSTYDVRWVLVRRGNSYRVRDVEVFGIGLKSALRSLFVDHIEDPGKGGSVKALVTVLNR